MLKYRYLAAIALLSFALSSTEVHAQTTGVGVGLIVAAPTGITAKFWTSKVNAIDFAIGWSNGGTWTHFGDGYVYYYTHTLIHIHADYLWHSYHVIRSTQRLPLYYGLGVHFDSGNTVPTAFGLRAVGGIDWMPRAVPIDVFVELAPVFYLSPTAGLGLDAGLGARFFFQ